MREYSHTLDNRIGPHIEKSSQPVKFQVKDFESKETITLFLKREWESPVGVYKDADCRGNRLFMVMMWDTFETVLTAYYAYHNGFNHGRGIVDTNEKPET